MNDLVRVLGVAAGEIGYQAGADPAAGSKYGRWAASVTGQSWLAGPSRKVPFCDLFVSWVFAQSGAGRAVGVEGRQVFAYTVSHREWFRARSLFVPVSAARPGDVVFFDWSPGGDPVEHVGIVEKNLGNGVLQTIEGNTSNGQAGSQANGGGVWRRVRSKGIATVCRPLWDAVNGPSITTNVQAVGMEGVSSMALVQVGGDIYATDGLARRHVQSTETVKALQEAGVRLVQAGQGFLDDVPVAPDLSTVPFRVKDIKDVVTGFSGAQTPNAFTMLADRFAPVKAG